MRAKIGVRIKKTITRDGEEKFTATVPMKILFDKSFDTDTLQRKLKLLEREYSNLIYSLRRVVKQIKSKGVANKVLLYWEVGDKIYSYEKINDRRGLVIEGLVKHLARDLGISKNLVRRCRRWRSLYPEMSMIDPRRSWTSYLKDFEKGYASRRR